MYTGEVSLIVAVIVCFFVGFSSFTNSSSFQHSMHTISHHLFISQTMKNYTERRGSFSLVLLICSCVHHPSAETPHSPACQDLKKYIREECHVFCRKFICPCVTCMAPIGTTFSGF